MKVMGLADRIHLKCYYLLPVLDGYNGEIIHFTLSRSPNLNQVKTVIEKSFLFDSTQIPFFIEIKSVNMSIWQIILFGD